MFHKKDHLYTFIAQFTGIITTQKAKANKIMVISISKSFFFLYSKHENQRENLWPFRMFRYKNIVENIINMLKYRMLAPLRQYAWILFFLFFFIVLSSAWRTSSFLFFTFFFSFPPQNGNYSLRWLYGQL